MSRIERGRVHFTAEASFPFDFRTGCTVLPVFQSVFNSRNERYICRKKTAIILTNPFSGRDEDRVVMRITFS